MLLKRAALYIGTWLYDNVSELEKEKMKSINKELVLEETQNKVKVLLLYITVAVTLILTAWIFNIWLEMLISFISFSIIRWWNGGHHFAIDWCYLVTNGVIIGAIPLSYIIDEYSTVALIIAVILNSFYAPFDSKHKKQYLKKFISLVICFAAYYINETALMMVFVLSFDLIRRGGRRA